jgi:cytochrome c oxidase subunit I
MIFASICGSLLLIALLVFFCNIVMSLGLKGVLAIFTKSELDYKELVPTEKKKISLCKKKWLFST